MTMLLTIARASSYLICALVTSACACRSWGVDMPFGLRQHADEQTTTCAQTQCICY